MVEYNIMCNLKLTMYKVCNLKIYRTSRSNVDIQTWNLQLESTFFNYVVWMSLALRDEIEAHFHCILTKSAHLQYWAQPLCIGENPENRPISNRISSKTAPTAGDKHGPLRSCYNNSGIQESTMDIVDTQKCSKEDYVHHQQVIDIIYVLEVKWCDKIANETREEDGEPCEPPPVSLAKSTCRSWFSRLLGSAKPTAPDPAVKVG